MDFIAFLAGVGTLFLLWYVRELSGRLGAMDAARKRLEADVAELMLHVARLSPPVDGDATPAAIPRPAAATPAAATPPTPWAPPPPKPPQPRVLPAPPAPVATAAASAHRASPVLWAASGMKAQGQSAAAVAPRPAGPTTTARVLERLGLSPAEGEGLSRAAIEAWLEGRMLAVVGGVALVLGAALFLSLAFSRGWITEPMRVLIGLGAGGLAIGLGELAFLRLRGVVGHVLIAVGLAIVSLSLFAATRLFGLIPPEAGVAVALLVAAMAAAIAVRHDSELVAAFGLVSVLASPPLLGAPPTLITILFLAAALVGTTVIALFRTWVWLPPLAFLLAAPQVASSTVGGDSVAVSMLTIAGFWLLNTIAAGGEELRHPTNTLRPGTVTLLLASAAFTLWAGITVLDGAYVGWRGAFVAAVALAHLALGLGLIARFGDRHPFGLVVAATGVGAITMAVPIQFGATWVPVGWAAEAVALAYVATRYRHPYAGGAAVLLGSMSLLHLVAVEYPPEQMAEGFARTWPFIGPEGLTFAFLIAASVVAGVIVRATWIRVGLGIAAILTTVYVLPFETSGTTLVAAWSMLTVAAMAGWRFAVSPHLRAGFAERDLRGLRLPARARPIEELITALSSLMRPAYAWIVPLPIALAIAHLATVEYPAITLGSQVISGVPYASTAGFAAAAVIAGLGLSASLGSRPIRMAGAGVSLIVVIYTLPFEVLPPFVMVPWGVATVAALAIVRRLIVVDPLLPSRATLVTVGERVPFLAAALGLICMFVDGLLYARPDAFLVSVAGLGSMPEVPFFDERSFALAVLAISLGAVGWVWGGLSARAAGTLGAALTVAWLLPFELPPAYAVAGWSALAAAGFALVWWLPAVRILIGAPSIGLLSFGALVAIAVVAPPTRLVVDATTVVAGLPILTDATIALVSVAIACGLGVRLHRTDPLSLPGAIAAALLVLYAISIGVVDVFQRQVGTRPLEDLQREAQLALSLVWSALGVIAFVIGLRAHLRPVRRAGLALLGLATVKVFIVDLASLDVAYRVLSLVGLGILLLLSAVVYARQQQRESQAASKA
jgi:uncharacterized membrane protein